jgi:nucleolar protein 4
MIFIHIVHFLQTSNKKAKSQPHSLLMADPGSSKASKLTLHGRVLAAVAAVSKDDADKLREDRDKKGDAKTDRRNLYLMREGGSPSPFCVCSDPR